MIRYEIGEYIQASDPRINPSLLRPGTLPEDHGVMDPLTVDISERHLAQIGDFVSKNLGEEAATRLTDVSRIGSIAVIDPEAEDPRDIRRHIFTDGSAGMLLRLAADLDLATEQIPTAPQLPMYAAQRLPRAHTVYGIASDQSAAERPQQPIQPVAAPESIRHAGRHRRSQGGLDRLQAASSRLLRTRTKVS